MHAGRQAGRQAAASESPRNFQRRKHFFAFPSLLVSIFFPLLFSPPLFLFLSPSWLEKRAFRKEGRRRRTSDEQRVSHERRRRDNYTCDALL